MIDTNAMFIGIGTGVGNNLESGGSYPISPFRPPPPPLYSVCVYFLFFF